MTDTPINKQDALATMARERAALEKLLQALTDAQMTAPGQDGWSIKDHLLHLAAWEQGVVALLNKQSRYAAMGLTRDEWQRENFDEMNSLIFSRTRERSLADTRAAFQLSHEAMLDVLSRLTDNDLSLPYWHYAPEEPHDDQRPVFTWIAGNTFGHYAEHREWIEQLIEQARG